MKTDKKTKDTCLALTGLVGLILLIIFASTLSSGTFIMGRTSLNPAAAVCESITLKSIPSPVRSGQSAVIVATTSPEDWKGLLRFSATGGILLDSLGNRGSLVETAERIVDYSGGSPNDVITVQADGAGNESCVATIRIEQSSVKPCLSLMVTSDPSPLMENQSARLAVSTVPEDFSGEIVIRADSGSLQSASLKGDTRGENTSLAVTTGRSFYYGGGRTGETIRFDALGESNSACKYALEIGPQ